MAQDGAGQCSGPHIRQAAAVPGSSRHGLWREQPCVYCYTAVFLSDTEGTVIHAVLCVIVGAALILQSACSSCAEHLLLPIAPVAFRLVCARVKQHSIQAAAGPKHPTCHDVSVTGQGLSLCLLSRAAVSCNILLDLAAHALVAFKEDVMHFFLDNDMGHMAS